MSVSAVLLARRLSWLLVVVLVFSAGCSGEEPVAQPPERPAPRTSPVATTEPTPEPTAEPPELPAAAQQDTKAGAVAFAKHYIDVVNYATETGDVQPLWSASSNSCESCANFMEILTGVYRGGGRVEGGAWTVRSFSATAAGRPNVWLMALNLNADKQVVYRGPGAEPEERDGGRFAASLYARWSGDKWTVTRLVRD